MKAAATECLHSLIAVNSSQQALQLTALSTQPHCVVEVKDLLVIVHHFECPCWSITAALGFHKIKQLLAITSAIHFCLLRRTIFFSNTMFVSGSEQQHDQPVCPQSGEFYL